MLLALETATDVCSVAFKDDEKAVFEKRSETHGSHSENLFLFIDELMNEHAFGVNDLDAVLVSEGPGSYTGLRIAASGVKGLLFGSNVPLFGLNTLASFALGVSKHAGTEPNTIHSIIDARRKHFYYQPFVFYDDKLKSKSEIEKKPIVQFEKELNRNDVIIGTGLSRIDDKLKTKAQIFGMDYITAASLIDLYEAGGPDFMQKVNIEDFEPKYYSKGQV